MALKRLIADGLAVRPRIVACGKDFALPVTARADGHGIPTATARMWYDEIAAAAEAAHLSGIRIRRMPVRAT